MGDWPKIIKTATMSMKSANSTYIFLNTMTVDDRLSACYQAICHAVGNIHRAKIIQNFAATVFHLCFLLRVRVLYSAYSSLVFKSPVALTEKRPATEPDPTAVRSVLWLQVERL